MSAIENLAATEIAPFGTKSVTCSVDACGRTHKALGLCAMHYARQRRTGDPTVVRRAGRPRDGTILVQQQLAPLKRLSRRSFARYRRAMSIYAQLRDVPGVRAAAEDALRSALYPNGSINISKFVRTAEAVQMRVQMVESQYGGRNHGRQANRRIVTERLEQLGGERDHESS
jgi:hypothetical protein